MSAPQQATETPATKKPGRWRKGLLIGAFALAVGALALDDLSLRVDNYFLGAAVVVQQQAIEELAEENAILREMVEQGERGGGEFRVLPQGPRTLEVSAKAAGPAKIKL
jgi:hypothetical protein